jgi:antitoxin ParD1/3/4
LFEGEVWVEAGAVSIAHALVFLLLEAEGIGGFVSGDRIILYNSDQVQQYFVRFMLIQLTADQESLVASKLQTGQYQSPEEILLVAFRLFEQYEESDSAWLEDIHGKIQEAYDETAPSVDGPAFIQELRQKIQARM